MRIIKIRRLEHRLADVLGIAASSILALVMVATALDATSRTLFNHPLPGVYELSGVSMALMVFLGLPWTQIDDKHIRVELIAGRGTARSRNLLSRFAWLSCAAFLGISCYPTVQGAWESFQIREFRWGVVQMPIWWAKILVALCLGLATLQMLLHVVRPFKAGSRSSES